MPESPNRNAEDYLERPCWRRDSPQLRRRPPLPIDEKPKDASIDIESSGTERSPASETGTAASRAASLAAAEYPGTGAPLKLPPERLFHWL